MEDGVKEDPAKPSEVKITGKAGWLKKSSGKFLGSYKDRYVHLDKTVIVVYDNEDLKNCVERLDLENFDKCQEIRGPFKKKYSLILTRVPKSGSKVCDVKLQAQNQEEKDAWIKALSDGINRAKNKIFDEVKVDESSSLEHVTRSRPKGNRGRRPPTRIHMKEVANVSSDGILRLDLDGVDSTPNGTHFLSAEETVTPQVTPSKSSDDISEEAEGEEPPKKVIKPPMPPSKENKPSENQESETPQKKVLMPPMPPSKEKKPSENIEEEEPSEMQEKKGVKPPMPPSKEKKPSENIEEEEPSEMQEKKVVKPPMPPSKENKPTISTNEDPTQENASDSSAEAGAAPTPNKSGPAAEESEETESCESASLKDTTHPPSPPSKDKKPSQVLALKDQESPSEDDEGVDDTDDKDTEDEKDDSVHSLKTTEEEEAIKTDDTVVTLSDKVPLSQGVCWDSSNEAFKDRSVEEVAVLDTTQSLAVTPETAKPAGELKLTSHSTPDTVKKVPPAPPKKKPLKLPVKIEDSGLQIGPIVSVSSSLSSADQVSEKESIPKLDTQEIKDEHKVVILPLCNPETTEDDTSGAEVEEKSIDSGQLSAEDSESGDQVTSSMDKLQGDLQGLDRGSSEEDLESTDSKAASVDDPSPTVLTVTSKATMADSTSSSLNSHTKKVSSLVTVNLSSKTKSASLGNLLELQAAPQASDIKDLQSKVSTELEETEKLLVEIGPGIEGNGNPEVLLAAAMEKLRKANQFLKEARSFKQVENKSNRTSW